MFMNNPQFQKPTVLYVDDEYFNLTVFVATFRKYYRIFTCTSAREAMKVLERQNVDLIITDQRMPEMTGIQFLEALLTEYPEPVRMILTGFTDVEAIKKAINSGYVLRYIVKPWKENELKQIIDMGIRYHELQQKERQLLKKLEEGLSHKKKIIELFQQYIPPDVLNKLLSLRPEDPASVSEGEHRIISTLFVDIREFTQFSDTANSKETVSYLNKYFATMINCVVKNQGSVHTLIGDGMLATFGASVSSIHNQKNAVLCALDMLNALQEFNQTIGLEFYHETSIGIGISTGAAVVGHIISEDSLSYVAIGETIDKAPRIEELTKTLPNAIFIDEATYNAVKDNINAKQIDALETANRKENIYQVLGLKSEPSK